eukprot:425600_1
MNGNYLKITVFVSILLIRDNDTSLDWSKQKTTKKKKDVRKVDLELTTQSIYVTIIWEMYLTILYHIQSIIIALSLWIWKIACYVFANPTTKTPNYQLPLRNTFKLDRYCGVKKKKKNQMKYDIITILMFYYLNNIYISKTH